MANKRKSSARHSSARLAALPKSGEEATSLDVEVLRQIIELLEASDVTRLSWRKGRERLLIYRGSGGSPSGSMGFPSVSVLPGSVDSGSGKPKSPASADSSQKQTAQASSKSVQVVTSPFVGTFYRTPAPDQRPFVEVGSAVLNRKSPERCWRFWLKMGSRLNSGSRYSGSIRRKPCSKKS